MINRFLSYYYNAAILQEYGLLKGASTYAGLVACPLMSNERLYDTIDRRWSGISQILQDLFYRPNGPYSGPHPLWNSTKAKIPDPQYWLNTTTTHNWSEEAKIWIMIVHRMTGSGASYVANHGYHNSVIPSLISGIQTLQDMSQSLRLHRGSMFTSKACQIPAFPKFTGVNLQGMSRGQYWLCTYGVDLAHHIFAGLFNGIDSHRDLLDHMIEFNVNNGHKKFWFQYSLIAADISDYLGWIDPASPVHYGTASKNMLKAMAKPGQSLDNVMQSLVDVTGAYPKNLEHVLCDFSKYLKNEGWGRKTSPHVGIV